MPFSVMKFNVLKIVLQSALFILSMMQAKFGIRDFQVGV